MSMYYQLRRLFAEGSNCNVTLKIFYEYTCKVNRSTLGVKASMLSVETRPLSLSIYLRRLRLTLCMQDFAHVMQDG